MRNAPPGRAPRRGRAAVRAWPAVVALVAAGGCTEVRSSEDLVVVTLPTTTTSTVSVFDLVLGTCVQRPDPTATTVPPLAPVACSAPHTGEVVAVVDYPAAPDAYPGDGAVREFAVASCAEAFESYVGIAPAASVLESLPVYPSPQTWEAGIRRVVCIVGPPDGQVVEASVRGARI